MEGFVERPHRSKSGADQAIKENSNESLSFNYWVGSSVIREVKK